MQSVITWGQLVIYLTIFLFVYYAIVILLFYRKDLPALAASGKKLSPSLRHSASPVNIADKVSEPDTTLYSSVHELMEDCKPVFRAAIEQGLDKAPVLEALQIRLRKYSQIKGSAFQAAVTGHIEQEIQTHLGWTLTSQELSNLWQ